MVALAKAKIVYKKMMNALGRKGRSRSKRELKPTKPLRATPPPRPFHEADSAHREPFVNHGLAKWNEDRLAWTATKSDYVPKRTPPPAPEDQAADTQDLYAALLTPNYQPLPRKVPLGELIVILQDVRELVD